MSEEPAKYGVSAKEAMQNAAESFKRLPSAHDLRNEQKPMSPQQRLDALEQLRWDLLIVGEQIGNPLQALELLRAMSDKVKELIDDARAEMEKSQ